MEEKEISYDDYVESLALVHNYELQERSRKIGHHNCIICSSKVELYEGTGCSEINKQEQNAWKGGTVFPICPGYGSRFDMDFYYGAYCDNCLEDLIDFKKVRNLKSFK